MLTVVRLPSGCGDGGDTAADIDLLDQEEEELLVAVCGPLLGHVRLLVSSLLEGSFWEGVWARVFDEKESGRVGECLKCRAQD